MNDWALPELVEEWDNTGFQIGDSEKDVKRVLISLDLDEKVYNKAREEDFQMIITHHPVIFKPMSSITNLTPKEKLLYNLIKSDIVAYNAHTNLDKVEGGVNDELADLLGLKNTKPLKLDTSDAQVKHGLGRVGDIERTPLVEYISLIKEKLGIDYLKVYGEQERIVKRIALCGGSGSDFIQDAFKENACIYITGDIKYHDAQLGNTLGLTIVDAGHFHTEKVVLPLIKKYLDSKTNHGLDIEIWDKPSPNYKVY